MTNHEEKIQAKAANEIMRLIIDVHTIMTLTSPDITGMQEAKIRLLSILEITGSQSMTELCNQMFISKPYMSRLVDSLVSEGSVERHSDVKDRRAINVFITEEGKDYLCYMLKEIRNRMKPFLAGFSTSDLERLCKASSEIHQTFAKNPRIINQETWSSYSAQNLKENE